MTPSTAPIPARRATRVRALALASLLGLGLLAAPFAPAAATSTADASGCSGSAISFDAAGQPLDNVKAPGKGGTQDVPFVVDLDGTVAWKGSTPTALQDGTWSVTVAGVPVRSGDITNTDGVTTKAGESDLAEIPAFVSVWLKGGTVVPVVADVVTATGTCSATVYISTATPATFTPLWIVGLALLLAGAFVLILLLLRIITVPVPDTGQLAGIDIDAPTDDEYTPSGGAS